MCVRVFILILYMKLPSYVSKKNNNKWNYLFLL